MNAEPNRAPDGTVPPAWSLALVAAVRAAFGVIWTVDAYLTWRPEFADHFVGYLQNASQSQPGLLQGWYAFWIGLVTSNADLFVWLTRFAETGLALGLLLGFARKWVYVLGGIFSLLIWATADGFGGPYVHGANNPGPALLYVLVFVALATFERILGRSPYSLDYYLEGRVQGWARVAEWAPHDVLLPVVPHMAWRRQIAGILAIALALVAVFGSLQSALTVQAATPANAAAAVSPLNLASNEPVQGPHDAVLPPLVGTGNSVSVNVVASDATVQIASGVDYQAWTFGGTVPAPVIHVRQGQTVNVTFSNKGTMQHSIDFHAAEVAPDVAYREVQPNESIQFSFVANTPGVFMYHCGTPPVLYHISQGMYGALVVDPAQGMPPADVSYLLVQSEWYTSQVKGNTLSGDYNKAAAGTPDEVVFNGIANQYKDNPLEARVGQRVRIYVVDAGPNLASSFHVIGGMFDAVYPDGDPAHALHGVSTYSVTPGGGAVFDIVFRQAGKYPFVDHSMRDLALGAVGVLQVTQ